MTVARTELQSLYVSRATQSQALNLGLASGTSEWYTTSAEGGATTLYCGTITDTANTHRGSLIEIRDGSQKGRIETVTAQTATGTINTTAFPATVATAVRFRILNNTRPVFIHDGGANASGTALEDSSRSGTYEANSFWNGDFAECIHATYVTVGKMTEITAYTGASGATTIGAAGATIADGDIFEIKRCIPFEEGSFTPGTTTVDRPAKRNTFAPLPPAIGGRNTGELTFSIEVNGDGTGAGDSVAWTRQAAIMPLLESIYGSVTLDTGDAVDGSATTTVMSGITANNYTLGNMVMVNGEVSRVTGLTTGGTSVTLTPALSDAPVAGDVLYASATFKRATSGHSPLNFTFYDDLIRHEMFSCLGTVNFSTDADGRLMANFVFHGQHHAHRAKSDPVTLDGSHTPDTAVGAIMGTDGTVSINGDARHCAAVAVDPGIVEAMRTSNGAVSGNLGRSVRGGVGRLTCNPLLENADHYDDFTQEDDLEPCYWRSGNEAGNTFVAFFPRGRIETFPTSEDAEGERRQALSIRVTQPGSSEPTQDDLIFALL